MTANYNEGLHTDELDNKASYIYGEKELWNVHSIESRNFIAIFIVEDRQDGLPVVWRKWWNNANLNKGEVPLKEISLYAKAEFLLKGLANAIPIKTGTFYMRTICLNSVIICVRELIIQLIIKLGIQVE